MTIKEVEERTGLGRSNIRFYEKEKLIAPLRNESNGYREYSEKDVEEIKKIAYLRTLGISVEDIRSVAAGETALREAIKKQSRALETQITDLNQSKAMCERILAESNISYEKLRVEQYVAELPDYWNDNQTVFKLDSVSFLHIWGSSAVWAVLTFLCLLTGIVSYTKLPPEIPIQWNDGAASSLASKKFIFAYPIVCIVIRYLLRPWLYAKLQMYSCYGEIVAEYLTNYMCFLMLSTEIFSILFTYGAVKNIEAVLLVDTAVLIGLLILGIFKINFNRRG